jgi:hypothetical protein
MKLGTLYPVPHTIYLLRIFVADPESAAVLMAFPAETADHQSACNDLNLYCFFKQLGLLTPEYILRLVSLLPSKSQLVGGKLNKRGWPEQPFNHLIAFPARI